MTTPTPQHAPGPVDTAAEADFTAIYTAELSYVWRVLGRLGVRSRDLPDVTHDVFVAVYRRLGDYDRARPIKPWLFGIAFREASHYLRRASHSRERIDDAIAVEALDETPGADAALADAQDRRLVEQALAALDFEKRATLLAHDFENQPVAEIAAAMSVPVKTVYSRLRLAREAFVASVRRLRLQRGDR